MEDWKALVIGVFAILWMFFSIELRGAVIDYKQAWDFNSSRWVTLVFEEKKGKTRVYKGNQDVTELFRVKMIDGKYVYFLED